MVYAGSRFTRGPETRYAPIEGEALAAVYGLQSCKYFILGCPDLTLAVDHKPLIKILNDRSLESINNPRMVQLKEKTMMFRYRIIHIPGKQHMAPDHLSRHPCNTEGDGSAVDENMGVAFAASQADGIHAVSFADIRDEASVDEECVRLVEAITQGFPENCNDVPECIRIFWPMRDNLHIVEGVPIRDKRLLIPKSLRARVLEGLHMAHHIVSSMMANARQRFFWPGLDASIRLKRAQ